MQQNVDASQNNSAEQKKLNKKRVPTEWFYLHKILENEN